MSARLELQQSAFPLNAPPISGKSAIIAHHSMTGDRHSQHICGARLSDAPDGFRLSDSRCQFRVADRGSSRDLLQRLPHPLLESRSSDVQGQMNTCLRRLYESDNPGNDLLKVRFAADQVGVRKTVLQI